MATTTGLGLEVEIRTPSVNDIGEILSMISEEIYTKDAGSLLAVTPMDLWVRIDKGNIFCAYSGSDIVGTASLIEYDNGNSDSRVAELATLYVKPESRNLGISTILKNTVVDLAIENGHGLLYSYTNPDALPTFLKWGFVRTESTPGKLAAFCGPCPKYEVNCNEIPVVLETGYMPKAE